MADFSDNTLFFEALMNLKHEHSPHQENKSSIRTFAKNIEAIAHGRFRTTKDSEHKSLEKLFSMLNDF